MKDTIKKEIEAIAQKILENGNEMNSTQLREILDEMYRRAIILEFMEKYYQSSGASEMHTQYAMEKVQSFITKSSGKTENPFQTTKPTFGQEVPPPTAQLPSQPPLSAYDLYQQQAKGFTPAETQVLHNQAVTPPAYGHTENPFSMPQTPPMGGMSMPPIPPTPPASFYQTPVQSVPPTPIQPEIQILQNDNWSSWTNPPAELVTTPTPPVFQKKEEPEQKAIPSINDHLGNKSNQIDLNDKLAFIRQLFFGSEAEYNKVVQKINSMQSVPEIAVYLEEEVKPLYNYWKGKDGYEARFLSLMLKRFEV